MNKNAEKGSDVRESDDNSPVVPRCRKVPEDRQADDAEAVVMSRLHED